MTKTTRMIIDQCFDLGHLAEGDVACAECVDEWVRKASALQSAWQERLTAQEDLLKKYEGAISLVRHDLGEYRGDMLKDAVEDALKDLP